MRCFSRGGGNSGGPRACIYGRKLKSQFLLMRGIPLWHAEAEKRNSKKCLSGAGRPGGTAIYINKVKQICGIGESGSRV